MNQAILLLLITLVGVVAALSDHQVLSTLACALAGKAECNSEVGLSHDFEDHAVLSDDKVLALLAEALASNTVEEDHALLDAHAATTLASNARNEIVLEHQNNALNALAHQLDTIEDLVLGESQETKNTLGYDDAEAAESDVKTNAPAPGSGEKTSTSLVVGVVVASVGVPAVALLAVLVILAIVVVIRKRNRPKDVHDALLD